MLLGFLLVLLILVCIALGTVILLQRSEGGAFGMGGGPSGLLTARGAGDLLTRTTSVLAAAFFILCLLLTVLSGRAHVGGSVVDRLRVDALNPDALNREAHQAITASQGAAAQGAAAPGAAGAQAPAASGAPASPAAQGGFEPPPPEVHTAPAERAPTPSAATAPAVTLDSGARSPASHLLGVQTAPQASPTVAAKPSAATTGNTAQ